MDEKRTGRQAGRRQQPSDPAKTPAKPGKRKVPPWMSDDARVVYAEEINNHDG